MSAFDDLRGQKTVLLTTFRRDGTPVATVVSLAFDGDRAVFRTWSTSGKAKRLRRDDRVTVAPATFVRGRPRGVEVAGRARLLSGAEARAARRALAGRHRVLHGVLVPAMHRALGYRTQHYELLDA